MTIGIYALYWEEEPDLFYIGQSIDIQKRFREHINLLRVNKHSNYKVSSMYDKYGDPKLQIVEKVINIADLDRKEVFWTEEFDSINYGLNIISAGDVGRGTLHPSSKYSKVQVLLAFRYSYLSKYASYKLSDISNISGVSERTISSIRQGTVHAWLKEKYPYLFEKMRTIKRNVTELSNITAKGYYLINPSGIKIHVDNMRKFARSNGLDHACLFKVLSGKVSQHKGYTKPII